MASPDYIRGSRTWFKNSDDDTLTAWVFSAVAELPSESFLQKFLAAVEMALTTGSLEVSNILQADGEGI